MRTRVEEVFHEVVDLPDEARSRYFAESAIGAATRAEVEELVEFDSCANTSLMRDISHVARRTLARHETNGMQCGPYRLRHLLGRGGMGAVYLAERVDGEVSQEVAVKLLRPGSDALLLRQRFLIERQILASLSHPNIARLLDAGHRADGQPYLVMEYVEGKPIDVYAGGLGMRQKLSLFLQTCAAVGYLHRNLVVHRDLKPANILVTPEGEPKLLDFGIAKIMDVATDSTATGVRLLTPDYASPEQVMGGAITTASDIYSLGAVLYKLLTGASPHQFEGDSAGAMSLVFSNRRITLPSKLVPGLKGDLEMILMKALRREPLERYTTVEQFSEDVENYLASRPIRARKGDAWYRTRKFLRRYWLPVSAATLAVAGLAGGVLVANHQRVIAQRRFIQVRQLSNKLFDIDAEVRRTPGTTKARELIVSTSLEYLQRLAGEARHDSNLALELGTGYLNIARLQGVPVTANLGHTDEAARSLQTAEELIAPVFASHPSNRIAILRLAQIAHDRMSLASQRCDDAAAQKLAGESAIWLKKYDSTGSIDRSEADALAMTYLNVGNQYATANRFDEAIQLSSRAREIAAMTGNRFRTGTALLATANAFRRSGQLEDALQASREAVRLLEPPPGTVDAARSRAFMGALLREGAILSERETISLRRSAEAVPILHRAFSIANDLARRDENDVDSRSRLYMAGIIMAGILRDHDPHRALAIYDHILSRLAELPNSAAAQREQARTLAESSYPLRRLGRIAESRERLDRSVNILRQLKLYPAKQLQQESAETMAALAEYDAGTGKVPRAVETYENLLRLSFEAGGKPETVLLDATDVSRIYARLAGLHSRAGHTSMAATYQSRRVALWQHWDAKLPNNSFVRRQLNTANGSVQ